MDRNTIIGFSLIFLILIGYAWYTTPSEAQRERDRFVQDSLLKVAQTNKAQEESAAKKKADTNSAVATLKEDSSNKALQVGGFAAQSEGKEELVLIKNTSLTIGVSTKGGRIASVRLNEHKRSDGSPLELLDPKHSEFAYELAMPNGSLRTDGFFWKVAKKTDSSVTMRLENGSGAYMDQTYALNKQNFLVDYKLDLHGMQNQVMRGNADLKLTWRNVLANQEKDLKWEVQNSYPLYKLPGENPETLSATGDEGEQQEVKAKVDWVAYKQQYFTAALIAKNELELNSIGWKPSKEANKVKDMSSEIFLDYGLEENKSYALSFYFGPNHFQILRDLKLSVDDHRMQRIVPLGWGIFGWVNRFIVIPVFNFLDDYIASMGIIILMLTLIIKFLLLPLVYKSYMSTAKMRILKPELDQIKEKHNGDLQKMQAENMALYRKAGVSPLSGCIPILLQMPILFAMFSFFPNAFELRQKAFLWSADLSQYDSILNLGFSIPFYGDHVSLFTLLMTVSTLIYTHLNNQISGVSGQMKWIGYFMPIIFLGVLNDYASGLTWYYFVSNMVTFGQQAVIRRTVNDAKLHAQIAEARKKPVKKSAFAGRLEQAMKQAQQSQNQRNSQKGKTDPNKGKKK